MGIIKRSIVFIAILFFALPFFFLFMVSLSDHFNFPQVIPSHYKVERWLSLFRSGNGLLQSLLLSLVIAVSVGLLATLVGFFISRTVAYHAKKKLFLFCCYFPLALSPVIYSLLINYFFIRFNLSGTVAGVIIAQLIITIPFSILLLSSFWNNNISSLEEISATLGGTLSQTFFKVLLPVAVPQLLVCFFQTFLISWFEYGLTTIIGVGKVQTLTLKVYEYIGEANIYYAALSSCVIIIPPAIFLWINKRFIFSKLN
jgi:putative spermidine/putrescine transport system permease protein